MKKINLFIFIAVSVFVSACDNSKQSSEAVPAEVLPKEDKIAIGTDIKSLTKPNTEKQRQSLAQQYQQDSEQGKEKKADDKSAAADYQQISWEDLEIPGQGMDEVLEKFEKEIESIPEVV